MNANKENKDVFVEKILKNQLAPPTKREFRKKQWFKEWENVKDVATARDLKVFETGLMIDALLSEIRVKLAELYAKAPKISYEKLMLAYVALSNREIKVSLDHTTQNPPVNAQGVMIQANFMENKLNLQEVVHGSVDGLQLAIRMCLKNINDGKNIKAADEPIDVMTFIRGESTLSQLYSIYEHVWQCIFWSDYHVDELNNEDKVFAVTQPSTAFEFAFENSANRKGRLGSQALLIASTPKIQKIFLNDKFVKIRRKNKKFVAEVVPVRGAGEQYVNFNTHWQSGRTNLQKYYPQDWFTTNYGHGFCIDEALEVMRCLMLMSNALLDNFPQDDSAYSINKLLEFCPTVQAFSLRLALKQATDIDADKISKILDFITATSLPNSDLWCQPLVKISNNKYAILVSALASPAISRVAERWFVSFGIDLEKKGYIYENTVVALLNKQLSQNEFIDDFDDAVSKRVRLDTGEEEIDLLARIDDLIIIGECKSIVTTDSEISKYRTAEILQHAGAQVSRKATFVERNIEQTFGQLGWKFDTSKKYTFAKCIVNSSQIFVGHKFNDVPVVDERILKAYFESNKNRVFTVPTDDGGLKDIAWYQLYTNLPELKDNLSTYLSFPPQLSEREESFEYSEVKLPYISADSFKIIQRRFLLKQAGKLDRMNRDHKFPLMKSDDYEEEAAKVDITY
ncbi:hypothetical protein ACD631_20875 (plasmid) [Alteromonas macleodii]|uniref:hypothetical protein n=1 Tax=Alteromonas macleodii TaxID=28108 RepID=UPI0020769C92|nr:hypothetical protein [Alteromonas macleodii]USI30228.1 hypothetical protein NFG60_21100 [Alteromonas macleodii]